jgi:hypothetical protein
LWGIIPRKSLGYLTRNPLRCWVCCDIDPDQLSAVNADYDEGIEQVEANGWDNQQIHGGNVRRVVTQEGSPFLARRLSLSQTLSGLAVDRESDDNRVQ